MNAQYFTPIPPKSKKKTSKKIIILLSVSVAILLIATIVGMIVLSTPKIAIARSLSNTADDLMERPEIEPILELAKSGSIEFSASVYDSADVKGKLYTNLDSLRIFAEDVSVTVNGKTYTAEAYVGPDQIYVSSNKLLGGCYGITAGEAVEGFDDAWTDTQNKETYYVMASLLELYDREQIEEFLEDYAKISKANTKEKFKLALKYGKLTEDKKEQRIGNDIVKVTVYKLALDQDTLDVIDSHYLDYLESNKDLKKFLNKHERFYVGMVGKDPDFESIDEIFEEYISEQRESVFEAKNYPCKYVLQMSACPLLGKTYSFSVNKTQTFGNSDQVSSFAAECDENGFKNAKKLILDIDGTKVTYEIKESNAQNFVAKIAVKNDWTDMEGLFNLNKSTERFTFKLKDSGEDFVSASGSLSMSGNTTTLKLQDLTIDGTSTKITGEIVFRENDEPVATYQSTKNIFELANEIDEGKLEENLYTFLNDLFVELDKHFDF